MLVLPPAEKPLLCTPFLVTCEAKQVQMSLEPTIFDQQGRTLISVHLMVAAKRQHHPQLSLQ